MFFNARFDRNLELLARGLDVSTLRYNVTANNIANADTPNFKRQTVTFEAELKRMLDLEKQKPPFAGALQYDRSVSLYEPRTWRDVRPKAVLDYLTTEDNNGNNVNIEEEVMTATNTQLMYQALLYATNAEFQRMNIALSMRA
ncbi:MAG TPA: flagellar basal body rod protein FlgB [Spirochaetia bacterium]|nr:flagellar basal body rod protein FlgB [Spirochaetia bacterium]